jgi:hypothetical protein
MPRRKQTRKQRQRGGNDTLQYLVSQSGKHTADIISVQVQVKLLKDELERLHQSLQSQQPVLETQLTKMRNQIALLTEIVNDLLEVVDITSANKPHTRKLLKSINALSKQNNNNEPSRKPRWNHYRNNGPTEAELERQKTIHDRMKEHALKNLEIAIQPTGRLGLQPKIKLETESSYSGMPNMPNTFGEDPEIDKK